MNVIPIVLYLLPDLWLLLPIAKTKSINSKFPLELVKGSTGHSRISCSTRSSMDWIKDESSSGLPPSCSTTSASVKMLNWKEIRSPAGKTLIWVREDRS